MSAERTTMHDFVRELRRQIPPCIHPSAHEAIGRDFARMCIAVHDPAEVLRLSRKVCGRITRELLFSAQTWDRCNAQLAYRRRQQAVRFARRWGVEPAPASLLSGGRKPGKLCGGAVAVAVMADEAAFWAEGTT